METKTISTDKAPKAAGPYSQAIVTGDYVFCSGQVGLDPITNKVVDGIVNQIKQIMNNLSAVLDAAGSDFNHVTKTTVFVTNMDDYPLINKIYGEYFTDHKPARTTVQVNKLPLGVLVEIDAIAVKK